MFLFPILDQEPVVSHVLQDLDSLALLQFKFPRISLVRTPGLFAGCPLEHLQPIRVLRGMDDLVLNWRGILLRVDSRYRILWLEP